MAEGKESKERKKLVFLSLGYVNQDESAKWAIRNPKGGLTKEQRFIKNGFNNYSDNFLTEEEDSLGHTVAWTVNWHHNAHQKRVTDGIWKDNNTSFIVVDARLGKEVGWHMGLSHGPYSNVERHPRKWKIEEVHHKSWKTSGGNGYRLKDRHDSGDCRGPIWQKHCTFCGHCTPQSSV